MENELEKNKEIEDAFSKIRLTCGTSNLKAIIEKILLKDKKYNYTLKKINEKEQEKRKLTKEIEELQKTFTDLKNEIVIDVDSVNKKDNKDENNRYKILIMKNTKILKLTQEGEKKASAHIIEEETKKE